MDSARRSSLAVAFSGVLTLLASTAGAQQAPASPEAVDPGDEAPAAAPAPAAEAPATPPVVVNVPSAPASRVVTTQSTTADGVRIHVVVYGPNEPAAPVAAAPVQAPITQSPIANEPEAQITQSAIAPVAQPCGMVAPPPQVMIQPQPVTYVQAPQAYYVQAPGVWVGPHWVWSGRGRVWVGGGWNRGPAQYAVRGWGAPHTRWHYGRR